jgi:hypothetical protein
MVEAANATETPTQLINIRIIIITKSTIFSSDIRKWHIKLDVNKTWSNFKDHFKAAQKDIKKSQPGINTDSLGFHDQADALALTNQVINRLIYQCNNATTIPAESVDYKQMQQQLQNMANLTQQSQQMLEQMMALAPTVLALQTQVNSNNHSRGRSSSGDQGRGGGGRGRGNDGRNTCGGCSSGRQTFKYCWTHGNCTHSSANCTTKSNGHIDAAIYSNMQGGSTSCCHWLSA